MKNKILINILAFISAYFIANGLLLFYQKDIISYYKEKPKIRENIAKNIKKTNKLLYSLERGEIVLFGSSELTHTDHKYIPVNFFNKILHMPLSQNGHAGHQDFVILSQLAALSNKKVRENARVVVFLSPGWFTGRYSKGTAIPNFLEYMNSIMMYKLYFKSDVDEYFKNLISDYLDRNIRKIKMPPCIYRYAADYKSSKKLTTECKIVKTVLDSIKIPHKNIKKVVYKIPKLDFEAMRQDAKKIAKASANNPYGINNDYFNRYVKPKIKKGHFPYKIKTPPDLEDNQEYQDLLNLLKLLKDYKIKPLFVMQDLNPYVYVKNRESMKPLLFAIKKKIKEYGYGYLDMWSYDKSAYEIGTLTDIMHTGELGWIKIDKKIIEHFNLSKDKK